MKKGILAVKIPELLQVFSFLLFLVGSAMALIEHGIELSLWLMTFAFVISLATTLFPILGITWLKLEKRGNRVGRWLSFLLQIASWITFGLALYQRLGRNLINFYKLTTWTMLLWACWLLLSIYSRYAGQNQGDDKTQD